MFQEMGNTIILLIFEPTTRIDPNTYLEQHHSW